MSNNEEYLSYEKLIVWEKAVDFAVEILDVVYDISTARKTLSFA